LFWAHSKKYKELIWTIRNNWIFNKREIPAELATKIIKRSLQIKKETEWIYITKIKESSHQDRKTNGER